MSPAPLKYIVFADVTLKCGLVARLRELRRSRHPLVSIRGVHERHDSRFYPASYRYGRLLVILNMPEQLIMSSPSIVCSVCLSVTE